MENDILAGGAVRAEETRLVLATAENRQPRWRKANRRLGLGHAITRNIMMNGYVDAIKKQQRQIDNMRVELAAAVVRAIPKRGLVVDFGNLAVLKEHIDANVFEALLYNTGCRKRDDTWVTPQGEEVRSPFGSNPAL